MKYLVLLFSSLFPFISLADPMCRTANYNLANCHLAWAILSLWSIIPIAILLIVWRIVINKWNLIKLMKNRAIITYTPLVFAYCFCHIENILIADLTIYDDNWYYFRDIYLIPLLATGIFSIILFKFLRKKERMNHTD